jgi:hypothetical protein
VVGQRFRHYRAEQAVQFLGYLGRYLAFAGSRYHAAVPSSWIAGKRQYAASAAAMLPPPILAKEWR